MLKSGFLILLILLTSQQVFAREVWLERHNRAIYIYPRRFGQEQPAVLHKLSVACPDQVCGNLAGQAVTPLLAAQPECSQQDLADTIIDASKQFDAATQATMIALAIEYRQVEKNTPPDFTTEPPSLRNSVFCQKAPRNPELTGLVQAQDPENDPNLFFDPALKTTVLKGSQANTIPFGGTIIPPLVVTSTPIKTAILAAASPCTSVFTVTVSGINPAATGDAVVLNIGDSFPTPSATPASNNVGNFGTCSTPEIEFGVGFDGRKETSFQPVNKTSFNHGSADDIGIITQFICDRLKSNCKADQTAQNTCAIAIAAAEGPAMGTGAQSDAFNAAFGITTNFINVASVDNEGRVIPGTGNSTLPTSTNQSPSTSAPVATTTTNGNNGGVGNFGKCSVPEIEFGAGFDGRRETSFQPVDQSSFSHGSDQNIMTITRAICDALVNTCGADDIAKATCAMAQKAAAAATAQTGAQADAFNAVFGIQTNFASITPIDSTGNAVGAPTTETPPSQLVATTISSRIPDPTSAPIKTAGNLQTFTGTLGGVTAPAVMALANGKFQVTGNSALNSKQAAVERSCDVQNNQCADAANASGNKNAFTVAACNTQLQQCKSAASSG